MYWYHVYVLTLLLIISTWCPVIWMREKSFSHRTVMIAITLLAILDVVYVAALHDGGFW